MKRERTFWHDSTENVIAAAMKMYRDSGRRGQTIRHYYYGLLGTVIQHDMKFPTTKRQAYQYLIRTLRDARFNGTFPEEAVVDEERHSSTHPVLDKSLADYISYLLITSCDVDIWKGQPTKVEVWVEKNGLVSMHSDGVGRYKVPVYSTKGYPSVTMLDDARRRLGDGNGWAILYAGDFDPTGVDIDRHIIAGLSKRGCNPNLVRVALTQEQTASLPEEKAIELDLELDSEKPRKKDDPRKASFIRTYGPNQKAFEIEALGFEALETLLIDAVRTYLDEDALKKAKYVNEWVKHSAEKWMSKLVWEGFDEVLYDQDEIDDAGLAGILTASDVELYLPPA